MSSEARSAVTGRFVSAAQALDDPDHTVVETTYHGIVEKSAIAWLKPNPKLEGTAKEIADVLYGTAIWISNNVPPSLQRELGLQRLLEAKDCFVRASL